MDKQGLPAGSPRQGRGALPREPAACAIGAGGIAFALRARVAAIRIGCLPLAACGATKPPDAGAATFTIEGRSVMLVDGRAARPAAPGSAAQFTTRIAAGPVAGDLAGAGDPALVRAQDPGGAGTFHDVAALLGTGQATNSLRPGDRIVVRDLAVQDGQIVVTLLTRQTGQPLTTPPSLEVVERFEVRDGALKPAG
jgi:hypothetical protein